VARALNRGEIWTYHFKAPDKRRPVLILTRQHAIALLNWVMVAPITSTIHGLPSEILVGIEEGLKGPSAVNLDNLQSVDKSRLRRYVGALTPLKLEAVCRALAIASGCAD
jgi:mRNA interferase MazF